MKDSFSEQFHAKYLQLVTVQLSVEPRWSGEWQKLDHGIHER